MKSGRPIKRISVIHPITLPGRVLSSLIVAPSTTSMSMNGGFKLMESEAGVMFSDPESHSNYLIPWSNISLIEYS